MQSLSFQRNNTAPLILSYFILLLQKKQWSVSKLKGKVVEVADELFHRHLFLSEDGFTVKVSAIKASFIHSPPNFDSWASTNGQNLFPVKLPPVIELLRCKDIMWAQYGLDVFISQACGAEKQRVQPAGNNINQTLCPMSLFSILYTPVLNAKEKTVLENWQTQFEA